MEGPGERRRRSSRRYAARGTQGPPARVARLPGRNAFSAGGRPQGHLGHLGRSSFGDAMNCGCRKTRQLNPGLQETPPPGRGAGRWRGRGTMGFLGWILGQL